jgi:small-conductance mechanosensitive channel
MTLSGWRLEERHLMQLVQPAIVFAIALAITLVARYLILHGLRRSSRGPTSMIPMVVGILRLPSLLWALAAALAMGLEFAELTAKQAYWADKWIGAFVIISFTLVAASVIVRLITAYGERQGMPFAVAGLSRALVRVFVFALGAMSLLGNFGYRITPLLTAFGVGGLAVALALQDTLANLFAGIHILVERPISVGDLIHLEGGQEGVVHDIGWRTTRLRTGGNDVVVIPNVKITSGILVNLSLPEPSGVADVAILVAHDADPDQVCRLAVEEASATPGVLAEPAPSCVCDPGVLTTHVQFKVLVHVSNRLEQARVQSELRMRLLRRFQAAGIPLPSPLARVP